MPMSTGRVPWLAWESLGRVGTRSEGHREGPLSPVRLEPCLDTGLPPPAVGRGPALTGLEVSGAPPAFRTPSSRT